MRTNNRRPAPPSRALPDRPTRRTGCITTDPAAIVLPFDDHMVHRGHGVFDTAHLEARSGYAGPHTIPFAW
eukprot:31445-Pelagococcus_subviridis.AAC.1